MKRFGLVLSVALVVLVSSASKPAYSSTLRITNVTTGAFITNSDSGGFNFIPYQKFGTWTLVQNVGITKPLVGSEINPDLDLQFKAIGTGSLKIEFTETGFLPSYTPIAFSLAIGSNGTSSVKAWMGINDQPFEEKETGSPIWSYVGAGVYSANGSVVVAPKGNYSLTLEVDLNSQAGGDFDLINVPEPSGLLLLGVAVGAVGLISIFWRNA